MKDWKFIAAVAVLSLFATLRVASTHRVFSATVDEPIHIAASHQWLVEGKYTVDVTHPPLTRMLFALALRDLPAPTGTNMIDRGNQLLYANDRYHKNLARARAGNLPLLILAIAAVAAWARRHFSRGVAILATAIFSSVPVVLGHAGLATTDLAVTATLPLALLALDLFLETPSMRRTLFLGLAIGLGVLSKFSFLIYFPPCALVMIVTRWRPRVPLRAIAIVTAIVFLMVWAGYRFDVRTPAQAFAEAPALFGAISPGLTQLAYVSMPAPALPAGFARVRVHDLGGHTAFLLGETKRNGWWYYFPVVFFYKTPIPLLILFAWGAGVALRERHRRAIELVLLFAAMMIVAMTASLNIGVRHIMPVYAPLSIVAAFGAAAIWSRARDLFGRAMLIALVAWFFVGVAIEHPDYLAWFNELAKPNPAAIAVDSNLDWGQDVLRLARVVQEEKIDNLYVVMNNSTRMGMHGINATWLPPNQPVSGWVAAGENWIALTNEYDWLKTYQPVRRIGKSIRLYRIP